MEWGRGRGAARPPEWQKTPGGGRHGVGGGVESPQGADTPGVAERPRRDETPGGLTAAQGRPGEDGQGRGGGDKNSPTARATTMQGAEGDDGKKMGGQRTAEAPDTTETAEEDGSAGPQPWQSDGADGARSEQGALVLHKYNLLSLEATEGGPANAGASGREGGHGALENREGTETEEGGD